MLTVIIVILVLLLVAGAVGGMRYRKILREAKAYERGLKMVPLLIHLPPVSSDIEVGTRDQRDVIEESISRGQVLYNVIQSTAQEGFKSKFYGQRHIAFELVASHGRINYYAAVPVTLVSVVQQAVLSAYPHARVEEAEEHNIFSQAGKISGTIGGELTLKEDFAYPIATFKELKRDGMQSILNALSSLQGDDGVGIQILLRPADSDWTKKAISLAESKRDGKDGGKSPFDKAGFPTIMEVLKAPFKPPEAKDAPASSPNDISSLDRSLIEAIEEKTRHPAYEVLIRVVTSSNTAARSQTLLNNIVAAFSLFDAPGRNGFKFSAAKDIEKFVTSFVFRFFPPELNATILNSVELATLYHLPDQNSITTSSVERQTSKQVDGPSQLADNGFLMGYNVYRGVKKEIRLADNDRRRHLYVVGQTGTGKSVLLENMAVQDMMDGKGFAFIDPHGDAVESLMSMVPKERTEDVIYFCPADMDYPMGLNLFEFDSPDQKDFLIQEAINMLYKLYDPQHQGIIGPRYEHWFRNASLTLMADPAGSTFIDIPKIFTDNDYAKQKLKYVTDPTVLDFWNKEMAKTSDYHKSEVLGWFVSKFGAFLSNEMMRNTIGQVKSSFNLREIMDNRKILLVNLSKGRTGELNSMLLGMVFVMKFQAAAMSRANIPEDQRVDFSLYVDEFQNFSTDSFASILSEARKYRLNLIVANQFIGQLTEEIRDAVFGNVGSIISLRTGATDADFLVKQFSPVFDVEDMIKMPNYNAVVRLMINGVPSQPFSMATVPPLGTKNAKLGEALKKLSSAKHAKPKAQVEKEIFARLKTLNPSPEASKADPFGGGPRRGAMGGAGAAGARRRPTAPRPSASAKPPSFLDDWLTKNKSGAAPRGPAPAPGAPRPPAPATPPSAVPPSPSPVPLTPQASPPAPVAPAPAAPRPPVASAPQQKTPTAQQVLKHEVPPAPAEPQTTQTQSEAEEEVHIPTAQEILADMNKSKDEIEAEAAQPAQEPEQKPTQELPKTPTAQQALSGELNHDDEIYIDKDGNIHHSGDE